MSVRTGSNTQVGRGREDHFTIRKCPLKPSTGPVCLLLANGANHCLSSCLTVARYDLICIMKQ